MEAIPEAYKAQNVAPLMNIDDLQLWEGIRDRLKTQRDNSRFCDVVFHVHSFEFLAHRCVLAACSPYFDSVLDLNRSGKEHLTISADWKVFSELIDFIYTGKVLIHEGNVAELMRLAGYFLMSRLKDNCGEFLERSMSTKNCIGIKAMSEKCGLLNLAINSTAFIQEHMNEIAAEVEVVELSKVKLEAFLNNKAFNITPELRFAMVSRWVGHKLSAREVEYKSMLPLIPLQQMDYMRINDLIQSENLYQVSHNCLYYLLSEIFSFGMNLGTLDATYTEVCRKLEEERTRAMASMSVTVVDIPVLSVGSGETSNGAEQSTTPTAEQPQIQKDYQTNQNPENIFKVVMIDESTSDSRIPDHCSYTKSEDIVKEHIVETKDSVGQVCFKPRFQILKEEPTGVESDAAKVGPSKPEDEGPVSAVKPADHAKLEPREADDTDYVIDEGEATEVASETDADKNDEENSAPEHAKVKEQNLIAEADESVAEDTDVEWKPPNPRKTKRKRSRIIRKSTVKQDEESKSVVLKISVKRKKGAKTCKKTSGVKKSRVRMKEEHKCIECNFTASSLSRIETHYRSAHNTNETFNCTKCDFETSWNKEYLLHMRTHFPGPPFTCDSAECEYSTDKFQLLLHHRRRHSDERPYECPQCGMKFRTRNNLTSHLRCHSGEKPYECKICQRSFATKSTLNQHSVTHSDHRPYLCDTCGFSTKYQSHLIAHKRIHTGDVYRCVYPECKYFTPKRSQLNAHMRIHMSVRSHICSQCGRGFVERSHLVRHEKLHSNEKGFKCTQCDYASYRRDKLKIHIEKHHQPGGSQSVYKPRKKQNSKQSAAAPVYQHPRPNYQTFVPSNLVYQIPNQFQQGGADQKPEEGVYNPQHMDMVAGDHQYHADYRTPPPATTTQSLTPVPAATPEATASSTGPARQPRLTGYIVQPMPDPSQVYTPQGDIGGLGAFMALF